MVKCSNIPVRYFSHAVLLSLVVSTRTVLAVEWGIEPGLDVSSVYNDNVWVSSVAKNQILDVRLMPNVKFSRESENSLMLLNGSWLQKKYLSNDQETGGLFSANLNLKKEFARQFIQLDAAYIESSTTSSETTEIGRQLLETVRAEKRFAPSWQIATTENSSLDISFYYSDVSFEKSEQQWFDYQYSSPAVTGLFYINDRTQWSVGGGVSRYELKDIEYTVDTAFLRTGVDFEISENSSTGLLVGIQQIDSELVQVIPGAGKKTFADRSEQITVKADYALEFENTLIGFHLNRNITPSSQGEMQFTDRVDVSGKYFWSASWVSVLGLTGENREDVNSNKNAYSQKSVIARLRLDWQLEQHWRMYLSYRWLTREYENHDDWIDSHQLTLSTHYSWDKQIFMH